MLKIGNTWVFAGALKVGDKLAGYDGDEVEVKEIEEETLESLEKVYNLTIEDFYTYVVSEENVVVHNKCDLPGLKGISNFVTAIDNKVKILTKDISLSITVKESFAQGIYKTVETTDDIIVYRAFGGSAKAKGGFVTTFKSSNRREVMDKLALLPEWGNTLESVATIKIPKGTTLNIGKVAEQVSETGKIFKGGADQILMPHNWPDEWIININPFN